MGQALAGLKLLTIAKGFDEAFDDLHPKSLRRLHLGPMYSHGYTRQFGPLHAVLAEAKAPEGEDWALAWTREELESERVEKTLWLVWHCRSRGVCARSICRAGRGHWCDADGA